MFLKRSQDELPRAVSFWRSALACESSFKIPMRSDCEYSNVSSGAFVEADSRPSHFRSAIILRCLAICAFPSAICCSIASRRCERKARRSIVARRSERLGWSMVNNSTSLIAFSRCRPPDPSEHLQQRLAFFLLEARTWHAKHTRPSRSDLSSPIPLREFAARADAAANAKARELGWII
jgi:hypothetical protein